MKIDAHQHFWIFDPTQYPWINDELKKLRRDFLPADLERELAKTKLDGSIAVQARQTLEESRWLLTLADHSPLVKGVVGWVDLQSERVEEQLAELAKHPKFVGVRHVVQDEADDEFMLRPAFLRGLEPVLKFRGVLFSRKRLDGEARRRRISLVDLRLRSNEARRPFPRKPSGRRVFCLRPALARPSQPAAGMLRPRRLGRSQNPSPQDPTQ